MPHDNLAKSLGPPGRSVKGFALLHFVTALRVSRSLIARRNGGVTSQESKGFPIMNKLIISVSAIVLFSISNANAQAIACKGLVQAECTEKKLADVKVCSWVGPRLTATKEIAGYCRASTKSVTKAQFDAIQAAVATK